MVRGDVEPAHEVEAVGSHALHPRVQLQPIAVVASRLRRQPLEQCAAYARRASFLIRDEIVDVEELTLVEHVLDTVPRDAGYATVTFQKHDVVSFSRLDPHMAEERAFVEVGPKLDHHGKAATQSCLGVGTLNVGHERRQPPPS
jgi:hypothetical protein